MGGDLFVIGALLAVGYLVVLPLLLIVTWQRSRRVEREFAVLEEGMQFLLKRIQKLEGIAETASPPASPSTTPAAQEEAPVSAAALVETVIDAASVAMQMPADGSPPAQTSEAVAAPRKPVEPPAPNPLSGLVSWFLRGNPIAKLGVLLLFFGLAFLFKYAAERDMFPIELRLAGAAGLAIGLLSLGWRLREKVPLYALVLQGGAIGTLYLTSFAAFRLYALLPHGLAFALLIVICAASVMLAVLQGSQSLAVLASTGGYLAPVLLSTGGGSHIALFSYYALLSLGILAVSLWQQWRPLNLVGFFFSFGVALLWGADHYSPEHYASSQFFLLLNLVIFGLLAMLFALRHPAATRASPTPGTGLIDGTLVFGAPLVGFGIQHAITKQWQYGPAFSALGFAAIYLPLAAWLVKHRPETGRRMAMSLLAVGAGFVTLAIPLALSARWTALAWALEGLGVLWAGRTQQQPRISWSGSALLVLAAISGGIAFDGPLDATSFLLIAFTIALCWIAGGYLWLTKDSPRPDERALSPALLAGGIVFWLFGIAEGADRILDDAASVRMLVLGSVALSAWLWHVAGQRLTWPLLRHASWVMWPIAALILGLQSVHDEHALAAGGWALAWPLALGIAWRLLHKAEGQLMARADIALHASLLWGALGLCVVEIAWQMHQLPWGMTEWRFAGQLAFCGLAILLLREFERRKIWPLRTHARTYWLWGLLPVLPLSLFLLLIGNVLDGQMPDSRYIPLINPLEEAALFVLLMLGVWRHHASRALNHSLQATRFAVFALLAWWANGLLLRTLAELGDLRWQFDALWDSRLVQTSFAFAWTLAALAAMLFAVRRSSRAIWFGGATLLGIVIAKLFLVDSAGGGGLARAIAFIGVALLILAIGYFAPLPPKRVVDTAPTQGDSA